MRYAAVLLPLLALLSLSADGVAEVDTHITLADYTRQTRERIETRIREVLEERGVPDTVAGTVTFSSGDCFFIQGEEEGLKIVLPKGGAPASGDVVSVTGNPSLEGGRVVFVADSWKKVGTSALPAPREADAIDLSFAGASDERKPGVNWLLVNVRGRVIGLTETGFAVDVESLPVTVICERLPAFLRDCEYTHPKVSVTGVAELILDQSALTGRNRYVIGVRLRVSSPGNVILEPDAVYLLHRRERRMMLAVVGVILLLSVGLIGFVAFSVRLARRHLRSKAVMAERKRMAGDLHDTIEQHLVGAGMLLQLGRAKEARDILLSAKREMRDIVWGLQNDDMLRQSPAEMIQDLARAETRKGICRVSTKLAGLPEKKEASWKRDLSLMIREIIGNAVKHGGAKKIAISCDSIPSGGWLLRVANDGAPFDPATVPGPAEGHFGLEGMKARARRLEATVAFANDPPWMVVTIRSSNSQSMEK